MIYICISAVSTQNQNMYKYLENLDEITFI